MQNKNMTILKCKCSIKSLIGFKISKEMAETLLNLPVSREYNGNVIGKISNVDYDNDVLEMDIFSYALPEINIDENGMGTDFKSISIYDQTYEIEETFKDRFKKEVLLYVIKNINKTINYKDCNIILNRERSLGGWMQWNWSICDKDGFEFSASFSESEDSLQEMINNMKSIVDDYYKNPEHYN